PSPMRRTLFAEAAWLGAAMRGHQGQGWAPSLSLPYRGRPLCFPTRRGGESMKTQRSDPATPAEEEVLAEVRSGPGQGVPIHELARPLSRSDGSCIERAVVSLVNRGVLSINKGQVVPAPEPPDPLGHP